MNLFGMCIDHLFKRIQRPTAQDLLGGAVFAFVQTDLRNNIAVRRCSPLPLKLHPNTQLLFIRVCALGIMHTNPCQKPSRNSSRQRHTKAMGTDTAPHVWSD